MTYFAGDLEGGSCMGHDVVVGGHPDVRVSLVSVWIKVIDENRIRGWICVPI